MSENTGEVNGTENKISRRDFLKKTAAAVSVAVSGLALTAPSLNAIEKSTVKNGISSDSGTFFPLYETHYKKLNTDKIPNDLDVLFKEAAGRGLMSLDYSSLFFGKAETYGIKQARLIEDSALEKLAANETEIMFGDVLAEPSRFPLTTVGGGVEFLAGLGMSLALLRDSLKGKKAVAGSSITKRRFLKGAIAVGASWLMAPGIYALLRGGPKIGEVATERENALSRIIDRIYGIQSNLHPEMLEEGMFRNLIMADKMLTVAEDFEQRTGRKAKIGFNVEYAHNGIEDFLRVGHDVCRWIIERYPTSVLRFVAGKNDGKESLWTALLIKLPKDFSVGPNADWSKVTDRRVVDVELQKTLAAKLG